MNTTEDKVRWKEMLSPATFRLRKEAGEIIYKELIIRLKPFFPEVSEENIDNFTEMIEMKISENITEFYLNFHGDQFYLFETKYDKHLSGNSFELKLKIYKNEVKA